MEITSMILVLDPMVIVTGHIDFTSNDRLYLGILLRHLEKLLDAIHVSMVSYGKSRHAQFLGTLEKSRNGCLAVKNGILSMDVKVDERHIFSFIR
jgi:hypothetical protein